MCQKLPKGPQEVKGTFGSRLHRPRLEMSGYVHRAPLQVDDFVKGVEGSVDCVESPAHRKGKEGERWGGERTPLKV